MTKESLAKLKNLELNAMLKNPHKDYIVTQGKITKVKLIEQVLSEKTKIKKTSSVSRSVQKEKIITEFHKKVKTWFPKADISYIVSHGTKAVIRIKQNKRVVNVLPRIDKQFTVYKDSRNKVGTFKSIDKKQIESLFRK